MHVGGIDAAGAHGRDVARIGAHGVDHGHELVDVDGRLDALGQVLGRDDAPVARERDDDLDAAAAAVVEQHAERLARRRGGARLPRQILGLVRLAQLDRDDPYLLGQAVGAPREAGGETDLGGRERVERMAYSSPGTP